MSETNKVSPVVAIAATSVTLFSLVGVGVLTGIIPSSYSKDSAPQAAVAAADESRSPAHETASHRASQPVRVASAEPSSRTGAPVCVYCGTVTSVNAIEKKGAGSGLGAIAGGVVGGVLGNQVGGGTGRTLATVAGVAGGALAGNEIEKRAKTEHSYRVAVRMDDGTVRHFTYESQPGYEPGDKVKVVDGHLAR